MSLRNDCDLFLSKSIDRCNSITQEQIDAIRQRFSVATEIREVKGAPGYVVSADGRVFSCLPCSWHKECPRELRQAPHAFGYRMVHLQVNKRAATRCIHQLVADAFLPPPLPGQTQVRHDDGDPTNNTVRNLLWGTPKENAQDTIKHGRTLRGRKNPNAKMTPRTVQAARLLSAEGFSHKAIGEFLGVSGGTVDRAVSGEQWADVS
jgi:hypothetical protein